MASNKVGAARPRLPGRGLPDPAPAPDKSEHLAGAAPTYFGYRPHPTPTPTPRRPRGRGGWGGGWSAALGPCAGDPGGALAGLQAPGCARHPQGAGGVAGGRRSLAGVPGDRSRSGEFPELGAFPRLAVDVRAPCKNRASTRALSLNASAGDTHRVRDFVRLVASVFMNLGEKSRFPEVA